MPPLDSLIQDRADFHQELHAILRADDELISKERLFASFERRNAAGVLFVGNAFPPGEPPRFRPIWAETIWPLPEGMAITDIVAPIGREMPRLLNAWLARRTSPVSLSGIDRFIPFSSQAILKLGSPKGVPALKDVVWVPYNHKGHQYCMIVGFFERKAGERLAEIVSLSLAYTVKWIGDMLRRTQGSEDFASSPIELSERELECLRWMVAGKTMQDTADIMNMSYANVRYHVEKARNRHGYATTQQLMVHAAIDHGLSPLGPGAGGRIAPMAD